MESSEAQPLAAHSFAALLDAVAAKAPAPGGGAVGAITGALGAALAQMVANYSVGRKDLRQHDEALANDLRRLDRVRSVLLQLAAEDGAAFELVAAAMKRAKDDPARPQALAAAAGVATQIPVAVIATCCDALRIAREMSGRCNRNLRSDLAIAAVLAEAAVRASMWTVDVNLPLLEEPERERAEREAREMVEAAARLLVEVERACG